MPVALAGVAAILAVLAVGASLAAATHPLFAPILIGGALFGASTAIAEKRPRFVIMAGIGFIGLVTVPVGLLTHGVIAGATSFDMYNIPGDDVNQTLAGRSPVDSLGLDGGTLLSFERAHSAPAAIALRRNGRIEWASAVPQTANVDRLEGLSAFPVLWRVRVDLYATGSGAPGWLYIWRWGGSQSLYVLNAP